MTTRQQSIVPASQPQRTSLDQAYTLKRVVTLAAMAAGYRDAGFVSADAEPAFNNVDPPSALSKRIQTFLDSTIVARNPAAALGDHDLVAVNGRNGTVHGVLWFSGAIDGFSDAQRQRALNDSVRLIEDSLCMQDAAAQDGLTGLLNRCSFNDQLDTEWRRCLRHNSALSLLVIDIDKFKSINDLHGHLLGDQVIQCVAKIIENTVHRAGDLVCRYGGEEFVVALPVCGQEESIAIANRLRQAVEAGVISEVQNLTEALTVSIGVATAEPVCDSKHGSPRQLMHAADQALYRAKHAGRNRVMMHKAVFGIRSAA